MNCNSIHQRIAYVIEPNSKQDENVTDVKCNAMYYFQVYGEFRYQKINTVIDAYFVLECSNQQILHKSRI